MKSPVEPSPEKTIVIKNLEQLEHPDLELYLVNTILEAIENGCVEAAQWMLERRFPERWGPVGERQTWQEGSS